MTEQQEIVIVVAMAENRVIGRAGDLPWHLPADLRRFKQVTRGHAVVMGRRTFESIGKPLPGRRNLVLTRDRDWQAEGAEVVHSLDEAVAKVAGDRLDVLGGSEVYRQALPMATRIEMTLVHAEPEGDTHFPEFDKQGWRLTHRAEHPADGENAYAMSFLTWVRELDES
ncbi:MAG: dihydrofolate reductase [Phycisphaeraceae bacterium]